MKASTYLANSMDEAIAAVRRDLGSDAVILESRTVRRGGVFGLFARRVIELRAATAMEVRTSRRSAEKQRRKEAENANAHCFFFFRIVGLASW